MIRRTKEGRPLGDTPEMKLWRKEFDQIPLAEHDNKLKQLGLDEGDIEEFNDHFKKKDKKD